MKIKNTEELYRAMAPLAEVHGYANVSRKMIADALGVSRSAVQYHVHTVADMREGFMRYAIRERLLRVVAQGLVAGSPAAQDAPTELKAAALKQLAP